MNNGTEHGGKLLFYSLVVAAITIFVVAAYFGSSPQQ